MTSFHSERVGLILLTLNRSKIANHSVHLLVEGKTTDTSFSLQVYSIYREKRRVEGGNPTGTERDRLKSGSSLLSPQEGAR